VQALHVGEIELPRAEMFHDPSNHVAARATCPRFRTPSACARRRPAPVAACANDCATPTAGSMNGTTGTGELRYMIDVASTLGNSTR